jgi:hypothetical protein
VPFDVEAVDTVGPEDPLPAPPPVAALGVGVAADVQAARMSPRTPTDRLTAMVRGAAMFFLFFS